MTGAKMKILAVIAVAAGAIASCSRPERGPGLAVRDGALAAYPKESVGLIVIEVDKLRKVKPEARWLESVASDPAVGGPVRELRDRFGADLLDTMTRLSLAIVPQAEHRVGYGLMIERKAGAGGHGKSNATGRGKVGDLAGATGADAIVTLASVEGQTDLNATTLPDGTLAIGPRAVLEIIRGNATHPGAGLGTSQGMLGPLDKLPGGSHIWGAVDFQTLQRLAREAAKSRGTALPAIPDNPTVNTIVSLGFHGKVGKTLDFALLGQTTGDKDAKKLSDAARALLALARVGMNKDQKPEWFDLFDSLSVEQSGPDVTLKGTVPEKTLEAIATQARAAAETAASSAPSTAPAIPPGPGTKGMPAPAPQTATHPKPRTGP
jgi:hypothetical protein